MARTPGRLLCDICKRNSAADNHAEIPPKDWYRMWAWNNNGLLDDILVCDSGVCLEKLFQKIRGSNA